MPSLTAMVDAFFPRLVQLACIKQAASGIIKARTSIKNSACLFISEEYSTAKVEFAVDSLDLFKCCPRTNKQILLVTRHAKTAENTITATSHFMAHLNTPYLDSLLFFDTDRLGRFFAVNLNFFSSGVLLDMLPLSMVLNI